MQTQITFFFLKNENEHELYVCLHFVAEYGMGLEISTAGDVYSYGVILLEMITGRRPTHGPFEGGRSLRGLVQGALPRDVSEVLDGGLVVVPPHHDDGDGGKAIILGCVEQFIDSPKKKQFIVVVENKFKILNVEQNNTPWTSS